MAPTATVAEMASTRPSHSNSPAACARVSIGDSSSRQLDDNNHGYVDANRGQSNNGSGGDRVVERVDGYGVAVSCCEDGNHSTKTESDTVTAEVNATSALGVNIKVDWQERQARATTRVCRVELNNEQKRATKHKNKEESGAATTSATTAAKSIPVADKELKSVLVETTATGNGLKFASKFQATTESAGGGRGQRVGESLVATRAPKPSTNRSIQTKIGAAIAITVDCEQDFGHLEESALSSRESNGALDKGSEVDSHEQVAERKISGAGDEIHKDNGQDNNNKKRNLKTKRQQLSPSSSIAGSEQTEYSNNSNIANFYRLGGNVDDVRRDFITLIRHNKLQYFYLGAIMYSVINFAILLNLEWDTTRSRDSLASNSLGVSYNNANEYFETGKLSFYDTKQQQSLGFTRKMESNFPLAQANFHSAAAHQSRELINDLEFGKRGPWRRREKRPMRDFEMELNLLATTTSATNSKFKATEQFVGNNCEQSGLVSGLRNAEQVAALLKNRPQPQRRFDREALTSKVGAGTKTKSMGRKRELVPNDSQPATSGGVDDGTPTYDLGNWRRPREAKSVDENGDDKSNDYDNDQQQNHQASNISANSNATMELASSLALAAHVAHWLSLGALLPLTLLLTLIVAITTMHFGCPPSSQSHSHSLGAAVTSSGWQGCEEQMVTCTGSRGAVTAKKSPADLEARNSNDFSKEDSRNRWHWSRLIDLNSPHLRNCLQTSGLLISLLILHLPLVCQLLLLSVTPTLTTTQLTTTNTRISAQFQNSTRPTILSIPTTTSSLLSSANLAAISALLYLEPILIEGSQLSVCLVCAFTSLIGLLLPSLQRYNDGGRNKVNSWSMGGGSGANNDDGNINYKDPNINNDTNYNNNEFAQYNNLPSFYLILLTAQAIALTFGLLKRHQFKRMVTKWTFAGAAQLIEARVSLEHQRQQQETLLLSVLPAYVAEQVKRNMVKKMNSGANDSGSLSFENVASFSATSTGNNNNYSNSNSNNVTNQTFGPVNQSTGGFSNVQSNPSIHVPATVHITTNLLTSAWLKSTTATTTTTTTAATSDTKTNTPPTANPRETSSGEEASPNPSNNLLAPCPSPSSHRSSISRLSAAGVAFLSETLASTGHNKSNGHRQRLSSSSMPSANQVASNNNKNSSYLSVSNNQVHNPSATPTTLSSSQQQQPHHHSFNFIPQSQPQPQPTSGCNLVASSNHHARRGFNELYIRTYNNVSLLYGDIVGFTKLCTQLSSSQLVRVLNDLFSHFDRLAERHKIMRIKILGDCYYGVSGIPEFAVMGAKSRASRNDNHAVNCVNMGLDMIQYIKCLNVERSSRGGCIGGGGGDNLIPHSASIAGTSTGAMTSAANAAKSVNLTSTAAELDLGADQLKRGTSGGSINTKTQHQYHRGEQNQPRPIQACKSAGSCTPMPQFELNMRIGIHSGHIHSGVIGLKKWQFDVWSNDVSIAMHCESSGVAGRVQVTESTIQQLNGAFTYDSAHSAGDSFLASRDIRTYLIRDRVDNHNSINKQLNGGSFNRLSVNKMSDTLASLQTTTSGFNHNYNKRAQNRRKSECRENKLYKSKADNEEKIRSATIETIKETILAGDTYNSNPTNSYGLAWDHPDMSPLSLKFRDVILNKLYSSRQLGCYHLELLVFFSIFVITMPLLNLAFVERSKLLPSMILAITLIIMFALDLLSSRSQKSLVAKSPRSSVINYTYQPADVEMENHYISGRELEITLADYGQNQNSAQNHQTPPRDYDLPSITMRANKNKIDIGARIGKQVANLRSILNSSKKAMGKFFVAEFPRGKFRSLVSVSIIVAVIFMQSYSISSVNGECDSGELHRLSVILILVAIDLSNYLLTYGSKMLLLFTVLISQIVYLWVKLEMKTSDDMKLEYVIDLTSETLILVLVLFSLTFARQIEYTNRANFLWRNRLNVDHEELEYISGINKVLLENILPSHVVQHYLTNPSEHHKNAQTSAFPRMSKYIS